MLSKSPVLVTLSVGHGLFHLIPLGVVLSLISGRQLTLPVLQCSLCPLRRVTSFIAALYGYLKLAARANPRFGVVAGDSGARLRGF